jgi:hypothetical protein
MKTYSKASRLFYSWRIAFFIGIFAAILLALQTSEFIISFILGIVVGLAFNLLGPIYKGIFYPGQFGVELSIDYSTGEIKRGAKVGNLNDVAKFSVIHIRRYGDQVNIVFKDDKAIRAFTPSAKIAEQDLIKYFNDKGAIAETKEKVLPGRGNEYILNS